MYIIYVSNHPGYTGSIRFIQIRRPDNAVPVVPSVLLCEPGVHSIMKLDGYSLGNVYITNWKITMFNFGENRRFRLAPFVSHVANCMTSLPEGLKF